MKNKLPIITSCLAALVCSTAFATSPAPMKKAPPAPSPKATASPAAKTSPAPAVSPAAKTERPIPYHGKISAVDAKAKTFTIAGKEKSRVFKITATTAIWKTGVAATMKDVVVNEDVRGSYWKAADGSLEAKSVKLGPLTEKEKAAGDARKEKRAEKKAAASPSPAASPTAKP